MLLLFISSTILALSSVIIYLISAFYYCKKNGILFDIDNTSKLNFTTILGLICFFIPLVNLLFPLIVCESILSGELEQFVIDKSKQ